MPSRVNSAMDVGVGRRGVEARVNPQTATRVKRNNSKPEVGGNHVLERSCKEEVTIGRGGYQQKNQKPKKKERARRGQNHKEESKGMWGLSTGKPWAKSGDIVEAMEMGRG